MVVEGVPCCGAFSNCHTGIAKVRGLSCAPIRGGGVASPPVFLTGAGDCEGVGAGVSGAQDTPEITATPGAAKIRRNMSTIHQQCAAHARQQ